MADLLRPQDLNQIRSDAQAAKIEEKQQAERKKEQQQLELSDAFAARVLHPEAIDRINRAITIAAQQGSRQLEVLTFPCKFCNDGGRRINNLDADWPSSLEGFAKKAYEFFEKELRPKGFKLQQRSLVSPAAYLAMSAFTSSGEPERSKFCAQDSTLTHRATSNLQLILTPDGRHA